MIYMECVDLIQLLRNKRTYTMHICKDKVGLDIKLTKKQAMGLMDLQNKIRHNEYLLACAQKGIMPR